MVDRTTSVIVSQKTASSGASIVVIRLLGDITSASKAVVIGAYNELPKETQHILLDFSQVEYLNSSGISLIIQILMQASKAGQSVRSFGLTPHFHRVFTMVGLTKYTHLHPNEEAASAAFAD